MPQLRDLLSSQAPAKIGEPQRLFYVINTGLQAQSGGVCCLWTVPAGVKSVTFEMWGAGGDGQGARCCERAGTMPTNGSYAMKQVDTTQGCQYTICAAGTGCQGCCCGITSRAFPSFVVDVTASTTIGCAVGGCGGCSEMLRGGACYGYMCCYGLLSGTGLGDLVMDGTGNISLTNCYCRSGIYTVASGGFGSDRKAMAWCASEFAAGGDGYLMASCASPSGSGTPGRACGGGFCYGQNGGYGFVKISYQ
jgi:hypothetical protein